MYGFTRHASFRSHRSHRNESKSRERSTRLILSSALSGLLLCAAPSHAAQRADLSLTQTVSNQTPFYGSQVTFTITVNNAGPNSVNRATVRDKLATGYTYVSSTPSRGTYNPSNGQWSGFPVAAHGSARLTIVATVKSGTLNWTNVAEVTASSLPDPDSTPNNGNPNEDDYAKVIVTPRSPNVPPKITGQHPLATPEDTALTVTLDDLIVTDPDNSYPNGFTLTLQSGANYTLLGPTQLLPSSNFDGTLTVPVIVNDGTDDSPIFDLSVSVTPVNDPPVITGQNPMGTPEDAARTVTVDDLQVADVDNTYPNGFTVTLQTGTNYTLLDPTQLQPAANYYGLLTVPVTVNDGTSNSLPFNLSVTVTPVNDAPLITGQTPLSTQPATPVTIALTNLSVSDPDSSFPGDFALIIHSGPGYTISGPNEITPEPDVTGDLIVSVSVSDGAAESAIFPLDVSITTNIPPVISGQQPLATDEDTSLTITLGDLTVTDPDSDPGDFVLILSPGTNYDLTGNEITPSGNFNGTLSVPAIVSDGIASSDIFNLVIDVNPVNDPPVINAQAVPLGTPGHTPITLTLAELTISDPDNDPADFVLTVEPGANYDITGANEITPTAGFDGELPVAVVVSDGTDTSALFDVDVAVAPPPNIIVIMADDLDTRSLGDLLDAGLMPNLQGEIIDRAVRFDQAFITTPLCCPSRSTFLTGNYPHNTNVVSNKLYFPGFGLEWAAGGLNDSDTIATRMQELGYTTGIVGKYLNGYGSDPGLTSIAPVYDPHYVPPGWSDWHVLVDFSTYCVYNYSINDNGIITQHPRPPGQREDSASYQTNVLANIAESFVLAHRDDTQPFFLWVTPLVPHVEICADAYNGSPPPDHTSFGWYIRPAPEFKNASVPAFVPTPSYNEDVGDKPDWAQLPPLDAQDLTDVTNQYRMRLRALLSLDLLIGRIVEALGDERNNTVLVFTSDNGWFYGEHRRTEKILAYDESARVPLYFALPATLGPSSRGSFVLNNDLAPTLLDLAAPGYGDAGFDGRSITPLLRSPTPPGWTERTQFLVEYGQTGETGAYLDTYLALRDPLTLYVESYDGSYYQSGYSTLSGLEMYDLATDPYEMTSQLHYPEDSPDPVLGPWANLLHTCVAQTCKQYENGVGPQ